MDGRGETSAQQQELIIRSLLARCKREETDEEQNDCTAWPMPDMVGYYGEVHQLPQVVHADVKKLVCSPDLPAPEYPSATVGVEAAQCPICHKTYASKAAYQAHQRSHAKESEDPYRCNICAKTFAVPARLTRHYRTHTGEKPFRCEFCSKSFSVKENLSVHRRIHTKERPYKCEVCARAFEHSGKLHRHMRIHTGERPHKCAVCSKTFIQSGQLVIHMRTHTGEKPYVCGVCQKGFTCSKQLKVHSRTHTGEKPYSCEICGKAFGYNHVLKLHQVAHYGEKVYKCTICNDTFTSKKSMEAHIKSHAEGAPPTPPAEPLSVTGSDKENLTEAPIYLRLSPPAPGVELLAEAATSVPAAFLRRPLYFPSPPVPYTPLTNGDDIRRRVEAALAVENIAEAPPTPPESTSPVPSVSPPVSPSVSLHPELSLPPRKRSKMILKSMEASVGLSPVRYSSVIQYARAS